MRYEVAYLGDEASLGAGDVDLQDRSHLRVKEVESHSEMGAIRSYVETIPGDEVSENEVYEVTTIRRSGRFTRRVRTRLFLEPYTDAERLAESPVVNVAGVCER